MKKEGRAKERKEKTLYIMIDHDGQGMRQAMMIFSLLFFVFFTHHVLPRHQPTQEHNRRLDQIRDTSNLGLLKLSRDDATEARGPGLPTSSF